MKPEQFKPETGVTVKCDFRSHALGDGKLSDLVKDLQGATTIYSMVTPHVEKGKVWEFIKCNEVGVQFLIDAAKEAKVPRFVYISSIAVTDHLHTSISQTEDDPLPPIETYRLQYDITKRKGEDSVIAANSPSFATCALRAGGILASPTDFYFARTLGTPGQIPAVQCQSIDFIGGRDYCRALIRAAECMADPNSEVRGQALFCTKGKYGQVPPVHDMDAMVAKIMGWKFMMVPYFIFFIVRLFAMLKYTFQKYVLMQGENLPGAPPHLYMDLSLTQKTFDNSKCRKVLNWEPQDSWLDAMTDICNQYKAKNGLK